MVILILQIGSILDSELVDYLFPELKLESDDDEVEGAPEALPGGPSQPTLELSLPSFDAGLSELWEDMLDLLIKWDFCWGFNV